MSLERITLTHVRIPLNAPFRISNGEVTEKDGILVRVDAGGITGVGEASPMSGSFYSDDTPGSVWKFLSERLVPAAIASKADSVASINRLLDRTGGSPFARAGLETAYWDIEARASGRPLYEILGGYNVALESGLAIGITKGIPALLETIEKHLADGYRRVKITIQPGMGRRPTRGDTAAVRGHPPHCRRQRCVHPQRHRAPSDARCVRTPDDRAAPSP